MNIITELFLITNKVKHGDPWNLRVTDFSTDLNKWCE